MLEVNPLRSCDDPGGTKCDVHMSKRQRLYGRQVASMQQRCHYETTSDLLESIHIQSAALPTHSQQHLVHCHVVDGII